MNSKVLLLIGIAILQVIAKDPPPWGGNAVYSVNVNFLNNDPIARWNLTYFYNANVRSQKYIHYGPHYDEMCLLVKQSFNASQTCVVTFANDGWSYIEYPKFNFCCKCSNSFGYIKTDWLHDASYQGTTTVSGMTVDHWTKQGQYLNHYYNTPDKNLPVKFAEIKKGNPKEWDFDLKSYSTGPIDPKKFDPPCSTRCTGQCQTL